jgi:hypothetical protein
VHVAYRIAGGVDEKEGKDCMDQAGEAAAHQSETGSARMGKMFPIGFADIVGMLGEWIARHFNLPSH